MEMQFLVKMKSEGDDHDHVKLQVKLITLKWNYSEYSLLEMLRQLVDYLRLDISALQILLNQVNTALDRMQCHVHSWCTISFL